MRRTATGASITAGAVLLLWLDTQVEGGWVVWGATAALVAGLACETAGMARGSGRSLTPALLGAVLATHGFAFLQATGRITPPGGAAGALGMACVVAGVTALVLSRGRLDAALLAIWIGPPLAALALLTRAHGHGALVALIVLSKAGDIAGYYVGMRIGRSHPFPTISPGKTTAGCVASLLAGMGAGAFLAARGWLPGEPVALTTGLLIGAVVNLVAQSGDLLESAVKRRVGVKDSGPWMGASGGLLDVLDSFLLTAPLAWICS